MLVALARARAGRFGPLFPMTIRSLPCRVLAWSLACSLAGLLSGLLLSCERRPAGGAAGPRFDAPAEDVSAPPAELSLPAGAPRVLFLGDSIGAGLHLAEHQAFPAVLQRRLAEAGLPFELINNSESGRTTSGGVAALDWSLRSQPDLVVIELGGNDGLRGIELELVEQNLRRLIEGSRASGAEVLLLGVRLPPNYETFAERFDGLYPRLAEEYGIGFVPFFMQGVGGNPALNLADGLHPTAEGHQRLADTVEPALRQALERLSASQAR
jgi:acyl-CoA thioesterase-1